MTLEATWGGRQELGTNAYIDLTQANSFIRTATIDFVAWNDLTSRQKEAAIIQATRLIDSRQYIGHRRFFDQALEFPRQLRSAFPFNRTAAETITQDVFQVRMQTEVQQATALQALKIARDGGRNRHLENIANGIRGISESVGPIREFVQYGQRVTQSSARFDPEALALIQRWMTGRSIFRK